MIVVQLAPALAPVTPEHDPVVVVIAAVSVVLAGTPTVLGHDPAAGCPEIQPMRSTKAALLTVSGIPNPVWSMSGIVICPKAETAKRRVSKIVFFMIDP